MPAEGVDLSPSSQLLTSQEIAHVVKLFAQRGVNKVRLTGGEPLVRKDILDIAQGVVDTPGINTLAITTNGIALKRKLKPLKDIGLSALNISLDTLVPAKFELITRRTGHSKVVDAVHAAVDMQIPHVKVNVVVMKGINDDELERFVDWTEKTPIDVRFIEYMPFDGNRWTDTKFVSYSSMLERIGNHFGSLERDNDENNDTSKHYKIPGFKGRIGFITSMTNHFCASCNRLRVTADGSLKVCLFGSEELSLRDAIRSGASDEEINALIDGALAGKHFALGGNGDMHEISTSKNRSMIKIGG